MKKLLFSTVVILAIALTACTSSDTGTPASIQSNNLPTETQLGVGILKLSGTDHDISIDQAKELVVYWEVYKDLSQSETAAQAEIDGLTAQIQETMTDDQMQAITDMDITQQDVITSMQGVAVVSSNSSGSTVDVSSGSASSGGIPAGGPPADGGSAPPDGEMPADMGGSAPAPSTDQTQTAGATSGLAGTPGVPSALVEAVIQSLQQKIAA
jgi:hypothetical protein